MGHVDFLEKARAEGDYVIVGLHTDPVSKAFIYIYVDIWDKFTIILC